MTVHGLLDPETQREIVGKVRAWEIAEAAPYRRILFQVHRGVDLRPRDWERLGVEYLRFSADFPAVLTSLIENEKLSDPETRRWLTEIRDEELGSGVGNGISHAQLFESFLTSTQVDIDAVRQAEPNQTTRDLIDGLRDLYSNRSLSCALGAQTAFELIGEEIIRAFIPIATYGVGVPRPMLRYFDLHLVAEAEHVNRMWLAAYRATESDVELEAFISGAVEAARLLKEFWIGVWSGVLPINSAAPLVFLSWSGHVAREAARRVKDWLLVTFGLDDEDVFYSDQDISSGADWREQLETALSTSLTAIVVLTPESATKAWVAFEAGYVSSRLNAAGSRLHVLVVSSEPEAVTHGYPLGNRQRVTLPELDRLGRAIEELVIHARGSQRMDRHRMEGAVAVLEGSLKPLEEEADRYASRSSEYRAQWLQYLVSLISGNLPAIEKPKNNLPDDLSDRGALERILRSLVSSFMAPSLPRGQRIYVAVRLSKRGVDLSYQKLRYRIFLSRGATLSEGNWREGNLIGENSNIHETFARGTARSATEADAEGNAPVEGEESLILHPVKVGSETVCAVCVSSEEKDPHDRLNDQGLHFSLLIQALLEIAAHRVREGSFRMDDPTPGDKTFARWLTEHFFVAGEGRSFTEAYQPIPQFVVKNSVKS